MLLLSHLYFLICFIFVSQDFIYGCLLDYDIIKNKREYILQCILVYALVGGRWDSNPRHSEPQSDALTNWTTSTIYMLLKSFSGAKVREKFEFHKFFSCFFEKSLSTQRQPASIKITIYFWKSLSLVSWNFILLLVSIRETSVSSWFPYCKIIEINQFRGSCLTIYLHVFALGVAILFHFMLSIGS